MRAKAKTILLVATLALMAACGSGCEGLFDQWDYNNKVDYYRDRGLSERQAERNASEDQFFDSMDRTAGESP